MENTSASSKLLKGEIQINGLTSSNFCWSLHFYRVGKTRSPRREKRTKRWMKGSRMLFLSRPHSSVVKASELNSEGLKVQFSSRGALSVYYRKPGRTSYIVRE